jgi:hypothetical protein
MIQAHVGEMRSAEENVVEKTEEKKHRHRWEDNIDLDLRKYWV